MGLVQDNLTEEKQQAGKLSNCKIVIALDKQEGRLQAARSLGATHTINTVPSGTDCVFDFEQAVRAICPDGPSVVVDTTGVLKLIEAGLETACARGKLIMLGATPLGYTLKIPGMAYIAVCLFLFVSLSRI